MSWSDRNYDDVSFSRDFSGRKMALTLVAANIAVAVIVWTLGGGINGDMFGSLLDGVLGLRRSQLLSGHIWRLATYSWVHGSVGHIFWNMVMLFMTGMILEPLVGGTKLLRMYLAFGVCAGLAVLFPSQYSDRPTIGASGAIMGVVVFLGAAFPLVRVYLFGIIAVPGWAFAAILVTLDVLNLAASSNDGTAHNVHLGGAVAGFGYGFLWPRVEDRVEEWLHGWRRRQVVREVKAENEEALELDRVLEKINQGGMPQLSERERRFLLEQSQKLKTRGK